MNYDQMSDFEINKAVARLQGYELSNYFTDNFGYVKSKRKGATSCLERVPDYCNNPSDAWPVIVNNGISVCFVLNRKIWQASAGINPWCPHENPLRAAMIVYLMMQENDK